MAARLRDAKFFWESDRRSRRSRSRLDRLHTVLFHKKLGSYRDKAERIERLAGVDRPRGFGRADVAERPQRARRRLAKADLPTDMVFEFPELQGTMGGIYAREEGQPEAVWKAIYHHYLPIGVEADAPRRARSSVNRRGRLGGRVARRQARHGRRPDRAGERATGSRDPFGLRRQMHGIVRILMDLPELTGIDRELGVRATARSKRDAASTGSGHRLGTWTPLVAFAQERVRYALEQRGIRRRGRARRHRVTPPMPLPLRARRVADALQRHAQRRRIFRRSPCSSNA